MQRAAGCLNGDHNHRVFINRREVDRDDVPGADGLLTLWWCPVSHTLGAEWEEYEKSPRSGPGPGGPLI